LVLLLQYSVDGDKMKVEEGDNEKDNRQILQDDSEDSDLEWYDTPDKEDSPQRERFPSTRPTTKAKVVMVDNSQENTNNDDRELNKPLSDQKQKLPTDKNSNDNSSKSTGIRWCIIFAVLFCLAAIISLLAVLVVWLKPKDEVPSPPPQEEPSPLPMELLPDYAVAAIQSNASSSQAKAYQWLEGHPGIAEMDDWRKEQLFALATFYYAFDGEQSWDYDDRKNWLTVATVDDECQWSGRDKVVLQCASDGRVAMLGINGDGSVNENLYYYGYYSRGGPNVDLGPPPYNRDVQPAPLANVNIFDHQNRRGRHRDLQVQTPPQHLQQRQSGNIDDDKIVLQGTMPPEIALLETLEVLMIDYTALNTTLNDLIPTTLTNLRMLRVLRLANNDVGGELPTILGNLTHLVDLSIRDNPGLRGSIPSEIGMLADMTRVDLSGNNLESSIPTELNLINTTSLLLANNSLSGTLPKLVNVTYLDLSNNSLSGPLRLNPRDYNDTERIHLGNNRFSGPIPSELGLLNTSLIYLYLGHNQLDSTIPTELGLITNLEYLDLGNNSLNGSIPSELGMLWRLRELKLGNNTLLGGGIPTELGRLTSLGRLQLEGTSLNGTIPGEVCNGYYNYYYDAEVSIDCDGSIVCPSN
jgi:hypothetical protein